MARNALSEIIDSLSANEKRGFNLNHASDKQQNYFQLYQALHKNSSLNNEQVRKKLSNRQMNISYEKAYLQKMLLRSLRNFHEDSSIDISLNQALINAELLYNKNLIGQCIEIIEKAKEMASETEAFLPSLQLLHWELKCRAQTGDFVAFGTFALAKAKEENELHQKQMDYEKAILVKSRLVEYFMHEGLSKMNKTTKSVPVKLDVIKKGFKSALSFKAFLQYAEALVFYYNSLGQTNSAWRIAEKVMKRFDDHPELKYRHTSAYIACLGNYCDQSIRQGESKKAKIKLPEYELVLADKKMTIPASIRGEISVLGKINLLDIYNKAGDYSGALPTAVALAADFPNQAEEIRSDLAATLYYKTACTLVMNNKADASIPIISYCLDRFKDETRLDMYFCFQALYLLAQYDIGNESILPSLIQSVTRFFKTREQQIQSPYIVLNMLTEMLKQPKTKYPAILQTYSKRFEKMSGKKDEAFFIFTLDIGQWIKTKLSAVDKKR